MPFIIFVMAASFSLRNGASAAACREMSCAEAGDAGPMANPAAVITAAESSEVINSFLLFEIRAFESSYLNLMLSPYKMMCLRCDSLLNRRPAPSDPVL
jgi:hypothetical protein